MRALLKWLGIAPLLLLFIFISGIIFLLPALPKTKRAIAVRISSYFARIFLFLLGVRVHVKHREHLRKTGAVHLIVSNHLSYVDVLVVSSLIPSVFITSVELKNTALLGTLARLSGCIFVERRKASGLKQEIGLITRVLGQGLPVVLFPEGTTSNGDLVQPFKHSLFDSAIIAHAGISPVCLRYTRVNSERLTAHNRDAVFYYGGTTFFKHFPKLLALKSIDVEIISLKTIKVQAHQTRKNLSALTHNAISAAYHE